MSLLSAFLSSTYSHLAGQVKTLTSSSLSADIQKILGALTSNTFTGEVAGQNVVFNYDPTTGNTSLVISGKGDTISVVVNPVTAFGASATWAQGLAMLEADAIKILGEASPLIPLILSHFSTLTGVLAVL